MSHLEHNEEEKLLENLGRFTNAVTGVFSNFKWACAVLVLAARLVGISMFTTWAWDCFSREFQTTPLCKHFRLFPHPASFEAAWLFLCAASSFFLIFYARRLSSFPGFPAVLQHLCRKKYFWKILVTLISVCIYDLLVILNESKTPTTISYVLFMSEKALTVALVLFLNFLPSANLSRAESTLKLLIYKAALLVYALEGYTMAILGSTIAVYKVLTVSDPPDTARIHPTSPNVQKNWTVPSTQPLQGGNNGESTVYPPDMKAVVDLMLLMTNNALRFYLADFFFSKLFDHDVDILGGGTKSIYESLAVNGADDILTADPAHETQEASTHVTNPV